MVVFKLIEKNRADIIGIYLIGTVVLLKYMSKILTVGLFCLDRFENYQTRKCLNCQC